jgi:polyisoprenoid-binding protein YceI
MTAGILPALTLLTVASLAAPTAAPVPAHPVDAQAPVQWEIDRAHSELTFRIRHMVSRVSGTFGDWSGSIVADPANLSGGRVEVDIRTASIDTRNERRDTHLRSDDFFDADNHPNITFRSSRVETTGSDLRIHGDLTIRGVTRPVVLEGRLLAVAGEPGRRRMGLEAETTINRMDYGVSWNRAAEVGGVVLGDDVRITIALSAVERAG